MHACTCIVLGTHVCVRTYASIARLHKRYTHIYTYIHIFSMNMNIIVDMNIKIDINVKIDTNINTHTNQYMN